MFDKSKTTLSGKILTSVAVCAAAIAFATPPASAQIFPEYHDQGGTFREDLPKGETVTTREKPELDALGVHAGSFFIFPSIRQNITYDDNIFATDGNEQSDVIYSVVPSVAVRSDWNQHSLNFSAGADLGFYFDDTDENYQDYRAAASGMVDVTKSTRVRASGSYNHLHESRGDPDDVGSVKPTELDRYRTGLSASHRFNRVAVTAGGTFEHINYENAQTAGGGTIDNGDRDRNVFSPALEVGYQIVPQYVAFIRGEGHVVRYRRGTDRNGFNRDSDGYDIVGGAKIDITNVIFGDFFAGYRRRNYDDPAFSSTNGFVVGGDIKWNPTRLTTVGLMVNRRIVETIRTASSGYVHTAVGARVDHELLRNLVLNAFFGYAHDAFDGITRKDDNYRAGVGANYALNRHFILNARYAFRNRSSNTAGNDFTQNTIRGGLTARW